MTETAPHQITICVIQPTITWNDPQRTFEHIEALLAAAAAQAPLDLVLLPEHFNPVFDQPGQTAHFEAARRFVTALARRHRVNLIAGSIEHWEPALDAVTNSALVLDRQGREIGRYRKRKLFRFEKQRGVQPGRKSLVVDLEGVRCGVLICADLWHPELVRKLEVDVLCVPAQTTIRPESQPAYAQQLWHSLAMTRAQEKVMVVAVSDQAASTEAPYRCGGVSSITDPGAEPDLAAIQRTLDQGRAGHLLALVDLKRLAAFRSYRRASGLLVT